MKNNFHYTILFIAALALFTMSCSTRGVHDEYFGATEQRLLTRSIDQLVLMLPENDFKPFENQSVFVECHFLGKDNLLEYAADRIKLELAQKYSFKFAESPENSTAIFDFFFTAMGTDQDSIGFSTPEFIIPGMSSVVSIDIISLDMYHGVSELYYYVTNTRTDQITRQDRLQSIIRTDKLALPIISIPINTLD